MIRVILSLALAATLPTAAFAASTCPGKDDVGDNPSTLAMRSDNDLYGRADQDQGYTAGLAVTWVSPRLDSFDADPCLPASVRWINRALGGLQPGDAEQRNVVLGFQHMIFTPTDGTRRDVILDDRPYAGVALMGLGYNGRRGDRLSTTHLRLGMVGPSAQGELGQDSFHQLFGRARFRGWDNELRDEVLVQFLHERLRRWHRSEREDGYGWDLIGHAGGSLGNFATYGNLGGEVRWGKHLPDDFGTDPFRPAGENTAPVIRQADTSGWGWHFFAGIDARYVLQDITLDGNTWKDSHSVDRREAVADISLGVAVTRGQWKLAGSHIRRTREFVGQRARPVFGSVTLSRRF
jgi:hypothetical protein